MKISKVFIFIVIVCLFSVCIYGCNKSYKTPRSCAEAIAICFEERDIDGLIKLVDGYYNQSVKTQTSFRDNMEQFFNSMKGRDVKVQITDVIVDESGYKAKVEGRTFIDDEITDNGELFDVVKTDSGWKMAVYWNEGL